MGGGPWGSWENNELRGGDLSAVSSLALVAAGVDAISVSSD